MTSVSGTEKGRATAPQRAAERYDARVRDRERAGGATRRYDACQGPKRAEGSQAREGCPEEGREKV